MPGVEVRPLREEERPWLVDRLQERWDGVHIARLDELRDASVLPALVAELDGVAAGMVTLDVVGDACEVMTIDAFVPWAGVGTALLRAAEAHARSHGCTRLWAITSNDNLPALRFYQRRGLRVVAVHTGAVERARRLKPSIPQVGHYGIEIRDELELEQRW